MQYPAFAPNTHFFLPALQKWQLDFGALCIFLSIICSSCTCTQLFLVPYSFFVFCCSKRHLSRYQPSSKGPKALNAKTSISDGQLPLPTHRAQLSALGQGSLLVESLKETRGGEFRVANGRAGAHFVTSLLTPIFL